MALQYQGLFESAPMEIVCLGLFLLRLLPWACSGRGWWYGSILKNVASSGLLPQRLLIHTWFVKGLMFWTASSAGASSYLAVGVNGPSMLL